MAEGSGEKSEKATPKKREDERKEGNVFQSKEVVITASMLVTFFAFRLLYSLIQDTLIGSIENYIQKTKTVTYIGVSELRVYLFNGILTFAVACMPMLLISAAIAIIATIAQTKGLISFKSIRPKFSRMNPISGFKRLFSLRGAIELLKAIIKIVVLFVVIYNTIKDIIPIIPKFFDMPVVQAVSEMGEIIFDIIISVSVAFVFLSLADLLYQRWEYEKNLRMTKQEVKEEYKNIEGDPQIKSKIKQRQQAMSRQRMIQAVPSADVIIRNPTHYAVALRYDKEKNNAPVVIAKGRDSLALRIVEVGKKNDVMITENKPLARALYSGVDLDKEIPPEFYQAVANILAVLFREREKKNIRKA